MSTQQVLRQNDPQQTPSEGVDARRAVTPRVDIFENHDELLLIADLPGVKKDALDLRLEKNQLHLAGPVAKDAHGFHDGFVYRRVFALPNGIDGDKVSAELKQGVLTLRLPKSAAQRTRVVPVSAS
jgi:HSP20 family molecular chaperone IbpA